MRVSPTSAEVVSGQTVTFTIECEPYERLWEYEVFRDGRLVGPAAGTFRGVDELRRNPFPIDAQYGPIPYSFPGETVTFHLPTAGWAMCDPPGLFATYTVRFYSVTCRGGIGDSLGFGFPLLNEDWHDSRDCRDVNVKVGNRLLTGDQVVYAADHVAGPIGVVDPRLLDPVTSVSPGSLYLVVVNLARLLQRRQVSLDDLMDFEAAVSVRYLKDGRDYGLLGRLLPGDDSFTRAFMVCLFPHLSVGRGPPTAPSSDIPPRRHQGMPPTSGGVRGPRPTAPTFRDLEIDAADVMRPVAMPFQIPYETPTYPISGKLVFTIGRDYHYPVRVVGRAFQGPPFPDSPRSARVGTRALQSRQGALVLFGMESGHLPPPPRYSKIISFLQDEFRKATYNRFSLALDGPFVLNPAPLPYIDWFHGVQKEAQSRGHPAFPVDPPTGSEFAFETYEKLARISYYRCRGDVRKDIESLLGTNRCPGFLRTWADKANSYTLFVVSGLPFGPENQIDAYSPEPGLVLLPALATDSAWFLNETMFADPDLAEGVWFNYGDLSGKAGDIKTRWDPSDPGRGRAYTQLHDFLREFGRMSLGSHRSARDAFVCQLADDLGTQALPFATEPAVLSRWGAVNAFDNLMNDASTALMAAGEAGRAMVRYGEHDIAALASEVPRVLRLTVDGIVARPDARTLAMTVVFAVGSVRPVIEATLQVVTGGTVLGTVKSPGPGGTCYLLERRVDLSTRAWPGRSDLVVRVSTVFDAGSGRHSSVTEEFGVELPER